MDISSNYLQTFNSFTISVRFNVENKHIKRLWTKETTKIDIKCELYFT